MRFQQFDKLTLALVILGLALPAAAQEEADPDRTEQAPPAQYRTVVKATKHIEVSEAEPVLKLLGAVYALKPDQNLIVLRAPDHALDTMLKVIDALDVPRPSIDLHVFVLSASKQGSIDVPEGLKAAVNPLNNIFGYSGFQLLDAITLRVLEGRRGRADGAIHLGEDDARTGYHFSFQKISVVPEDGFNSIRLKDLKFAVNGQVAGAPRASLMTDVQVREGQKAVIGSSTPQGAGETLILIVEATASPDRSWKGK